MYSTFVILALFIEMRSGDVCLWKNVYNGSTLIKKKKNVQKSTELE